MRVSASFDKSNISFFELVNLLNPEPIIIDTCLPPLQDTDAYFTRLITWQGLTDKGMTTEMLYDRQEYPFSPSLETLSHNLNFSSFIQFLKHSQSIKDTLVNFRLLQIEWFIRTSIVRNPYASGYAPKRLNRGVKFILTEDFLTTSFQSVMESQWYTCDHNPTKVIPLTVGNLGVVIEQVTTLALDHHKDHPSK